MTVEIRCMGCKEVYVCTERNTKIFGPVIDATCPLCGNFVSKNYSAFLADQTEDMVEQTARAIKMIKLARLISGVVSNEESFQKKKK